jgi:hypothetical protein
MTTMEHTSRLKHTHTHVAVDDSFCGVLGVDDSSISRRQTAFAIATMAEPQTPLPSGADPVDSSPIWTPTPSNSRATQGLESELEPGDDFLASLAAAAALTALAELVRRPKDVIPPSNLITSRR